MKTIWDILQEDIGFLLSLVPDWASEVPPNLDATFYGTGTYEGDLEVKKKIDKIKEKIKEKYGLE